MWYGVGYNDGFEVGIVNFGDRIAAEYAVRANGVDFFGAGLLKLLCGEAKRTARIGHVVDENGYTIGHIADQHHRLYFVGANAFLVNERKVHVKPIGY